MFLSLKKFLPVDRTDKRPVKEREREASFAVWFCLERFSFKTRERLEAKHEGESGWGRGGGGGGRELF